MATEQEVEVFSGNDIVLQVTVTDADNNDEPLDLTGATAVEYALAKNANATPIISKSLADGISITDAVAGELEIVLDDDELEPLKGNYYHELRLTNAEGKKSTLLYGAFTIAANLVRG